MLGKWGNYERKNRKQLLINLFEIKTSVTEEYTLKMYKRKAEKIHESIYVGLQCIKR
jgi:hypothetical protein